MRENLPRKKRKRTREGSFSFWRLVSSRSRFRRLHAGLARWCTAARPVPTWGHPADSACPTIGTGESVHLELSSKGDKCKSVIDARPPSFFPDYVRTRTERLATSSRVMCAHAQNVFAICFRLMCANAQNVLRHRGDSCRYDIRGQNPAAVRGDPRP